MLRNRKYQFTAILGDLKHKNDVYILFGDFGSVPEAYFPNSAQAAYLRKFRPDLIDEDIPGRLSDHTVATIFEYCYYVDPNFASDYLKHLNDIKRGDAFCTQCNTRLTHIICEVCNPRGRQVQSCF